MLRSKIRISISNRYLSTSTVVDPRTTTNPISELPRKAVWKHSQRVLKAKLREYNDDLDFFVQRPAKLQSFIEDNYTVSYEALQYWMTQKTAYVDGDRQLQHQLNYESHSSKEKKDVKYHSQDWLKVLNSPTALLNTDTFISQSSTSGLLKRIDLTFNQVYIKELISFYETVCGRELNDDEISVELLDEIRSFIVSNEMSNYKNTIKSRADYRIDDELSQRLIDELNSGAVLDDETADKALLSTLPDIHRDRLTDILLSMISGGLCLTPFETHYLVTNQSKLGKTLDYTLKFIDENKSQLDISAGVYNSLLKRTPKDKAKTNKILEHMSVNRVLPDCNTISLLVESIDHNATQLHNLVFLSRALLKFDLDTALAEKLAQAFVRAGQPHTALNLLCGCVLSCLNQAVDASTATTLELKTHGMPLLQKTKYYLDAVAAPPDSLFSSHSYSPSDRLILNHLLLKHAEISTRATLFNHCVRPSPRLVAHVLGAAVAFPRGAREALAVVYAVLDRFRMT